MMREQEIVDTLSNLKHRIFPRPFERLGVAGKGLVGVEIGVYKAEHAFALLEYLDIRRLYLIDPYDLYDAYSEGKANYGVTQAPLSEAKKTAEDRLAPYADRITWIHKMSTDAAREIPDELDFVYIDGNHEESFVREDILAYWPKVRQGGTVGGHDFYNGYCRDHDGVVKAVSRFAVESGFPLQVELPDWWIKK
jgi:hypothetical protein